MRCETIRGHAAVVGARAAAIDAHGRIPLPSPFAPGYLSRRVCLRLATAQTQSINTNRPRTGSPCTQSSNQAASSTASSSARRSRSIAWTSSPATPSRSTASCLVADGEDAAVGQPVVDGAAVSAEVLGQDRGEKIIVFKYKPKARTRVKKGFRAELTTLRISDIAFAGKSAAKDAEKSAEGKKAKEAKAAEKAAAKAAEDRLPRTRSWLPSWPLPRRRPRRRGRRGQGQGRTQEEVDRQEGQLPRRPLSQRLRQRPRHAEDAEPVPEAEAES